MKRLAPLTFAGFLLTLPAAAHAVVTGALDPTFGTNGKVDVPGYGLAAQTDGKIVALGEGTGGSGGFGYVGRFSLARLTSTGAIDFSRTDVVGTCSICGAGAATAATLVQPDGSILSAGTYAYIHSGTNSRYFVATRHLANGDLDSSFGSAGVASVHFGIARGVALQSDGKAVLAGGYRPDEFLSPSLPPWAHGLVRLNTDGLPDSTFGTNGSAIAALGTSNSEVNAVAIRPDGTIVTAGYAMSGSNRVWALARFSSAGVLEASSVLDFGPGGPSGAEAYAIAVQPDGNFVVGGSAASGFVLARFTAPGAYDPAFAGTGKVTGPGAAIRALVIQPDGRIVVALADGEALRFLANGQQDGAFGIGGRVSTGMSDVKSVALQADGRIVVGSATQVARIDPALASPIEPAPTVVSFPEQFLHTKSAPQTVTFSNASGVSQTIASITVTAGFKVTHNCTALAAGGTCTASVTFAPVTEGPIPGDLVVTGSAGTQKVYLSGIGGDSLTTHYYEAILRRAPDASGKAFWDSEAARMQSIGANINEAWFSMAQSFFFSAEYLGFDRDDAAFVTDLYNTFFNRAPDADGLAFWTGQLAQGMPREVVLAAFELSPEFVSFTQAIFGNAAARAEVDTVMDFYRGLMSRLPDPSGFNNWVQYFRNSQCAGAQEVYTAAQTISSQFVNSSEYAVKNRTNAQYVGDLYNAFLRRGGDLQGVQFWIGQLNGGASRDSVRQSFIQSTEFQGRVTAIVNQGCFT